MGNSLSRRDSAAMLEAVEAGSEELLGGGAPQAAQAVGQDFLRRVEQPRRKWPRAWRKHPSDVARGRLFAYHIMNVNERAQRPNSGSAIVWARLGSRLCRDLGWNALHRDFQMMELMSVAARRRPDELATSLRRFDGFTQLPVGAPLRTEYCARVIDLLHMTEDWEGVVEVAARQLVPLSRLAEPPAFQAARLLTCVRGSLRAHGASADVERLIDEADELLAASARESGHPHRYFEHWLLCSRAELEAVAGHTGSALELVEAADEQRRAGGFDAGFVRDAVALARRQ